MGRPEAATGLGVVGVLCTMLWCPVADAGAAAEPTEPARAAIRVKDFRRAAEALRLLADSGNSHAQFLLGSLYRVGLGVPVQQAEARKLFAAAADRKHVAAAYSMAMLLATEEPRDEEQARIWLKRAADGGHSLARAALSRGSLPLEFLPQKDLTEAGARRAALWLAVQQNDPQLVTLLADEDSIRRTDEFGRNILAIAAQSGAAEVVPALLARGARADQADSFGMTPLMLAARRADTTIIAALLQAHAPLDSADRAGNSALMYAAAAAHETVVAQLLDAGASVSALNVQGWSALDWAVYADAGSAADLLRARGLSTKRAVDAVAGSPAIPLLRASGVTDLYSGQSDLQVAASRSSPELLQAVLRHEREANRAGAVPAAAVFPLVTTGSHATMKVALTAGIGKAAVSPDALRWLAMRGDAAILTMLLAHREQPPSDRGSILAAAVRAHRVENVRVLLDADADVNAMDEEGRTPLMLAAGSGQSAVVSELLRHLAQPNLVDKVGRTALWYAAAAGDANAVDALLAAKAGAERADVSGATPLIVAAANGHAAAAASLLSVGARVDATTKSGSTALMLAAKAGHTAVIGQLLAANIRIDAQNRYGDTALIVAARAGQAAVVRQLLAAGASDKLRNADRATALDVASALELGNIQVLLQRG